MEGQSERVPNIAGVLVGLMLLVASKTYLALARNPVDTDFFTHLAMGRWIVEHRAIPSYDVLSWTGKLLHLPYTYQEWLYDIGQFVLWRHFGIAGVYLVTAALTASIALLLFLLARRRTGRPITALIVALVGYVAITASIAPRPQLVTFALLLVCALLFESKRPWLVLPVYLLGIQLHGGTYPLYLVVAGYYSLRERRYLPLAAMVALTVLTPSALGLVTYPFRAFTSVSGLPIIETQPVALGRQPLHFAILLAAAVVAIRRPVPWLDRLFVLALAGLSLLALRHLGWFYILGLPVIAAHVPFPSIERRAEAEESALAEAGKVSRLDRVGSLVLVGSLLLASIPVSAQAALIRLDEDRSFPKDAVAYVRAHGLSRVMNGLREGGYLLAHGVPTMVDARIDPFTASTNGSRDLMGRYTDALFVMKDPRPFLDEYRVQALLIPRDSQLALALADRPQFPLLYGDASFVVIGYEPGATVGAEKETPTGRE